MSDEIEEKQIPANQEEKDYTNFYLVDFIRVDKSDNPKSRTPLVCRWSLVGHDPQGGRATLFRNASEAHVAAIEVLYRESGREWEEEKKGSLQQLRELLKSLNENEDYKKELNPSKTIATVTSTPLPQSSLLQAVTREEEEEGDLYIPSSAWWHFRKESGMNV